MCEKSCQSWTGRLPSVKDFDWLKENYIPKAKWSYLRSKRFPYKIALYYIFEQKKGFYHTAKKGSSKPGKLKDVCSHGKCHNGPLTT